MLHMFLTCVRETIGRLCTKKCKKFWKKMESESIIVAHQIDKTS